MRISRNNMLLQGMLLLQILAAVTVAFSPQVKLPSLMMERKQDQIMRTQLKAALPPPEIDLKTISLVTGQEAYGFGVVALGEAVYSFLQAPNFDNAKVLIPGIVAAVIMFAVSGPAVSSAGGDMGSIGFGLEVACVVSLAMGASYIARMLAPYSPAPKEVAFLGLLISIAGFASFGQNLIIDGFITLPSLPFDLPELPHVDYGDFADEEGF